MKTLLAFFRPLRSIASELRIIRELYELDLQSRDNPIIRQTERPSKADTEVSYSGVTDRTPRHKRWFKPGEESEMEGD